jgi:large subunit ribosomal protein L4
MATEAPLPRSEAYNPVSHSQGLSPTPPPPRRQAPKEPDVLTTIYNFPSLEPKGEAYYPANQLYLPLRRDILHRAVIFEGDSTRQGTASTKWRDDVHGSFRKIRPQKGSGRARLGDKKSPMLKGGGVAFGPHPRDFSTKLPRKIYDLAWRTALSYRYKRGELIVLEDGAEIEQAEPRWISQIMEWHKLGNANGRSLIITNGFPSNLMYALAGAGQHGRVLGKDDVDVKDLLELGRIMIEKTQLDNILEEHSSDLYRTVPAAVYNDV